MTIEILKNIFLFFWHLLFKIPAIKRLRERTIEQMVQDDRYEMRKKHDKELEANDKKWEEVVRINNKNSKIREKSIIEDRDRTIERARKEIDAERREVREREARCVLREETLDSAIQRVEIQENKYIQDKSRLKNARAYVDRLIELLQQAVKTAGVIDKAMEETNAEEEQKKIDEFIDSIKNGTPVE